MRLLSLIILSTIIILSLQAQTWKPIGMHGGGKVTGIIPHPTDINTVYNRTDVAGVNVSYDACLTWQSLTFNVPKDNPHNFRVRNFVIDPNNTDVLYFCSGNSPNSANSSIWKSTDAGTNWNRISNPTQFTGNGDFRWSDETMVINPNNSQELFVGGQPTASGGVWQGNGGVYISTNGGSSWSAISAVFNNAWVTGIKYHPTDTDLIYISAAITSSGGVNSIGAGLWSYRISNTTLTQLYTADVVDFDFDANNPSIMIVTADAGIHKSTNAGNTWTTLPAPTDHGYGYYITAHPTESGHWFFGAEKGFNNHGILETTDGGNSFYLIKYTDKTNREQHLTFPSYVDKNFKNVFANSLVGLYFSPVNPTTAYFDNVWKTENASGTLADPNITSEYDNARWDWTWLAYGIHIMVTIRVSPHITDEDRFYINVADVCAYESTNAGQTACYTGLPMNYSASVEFCKAQPTIGYMGGQYFDDTGQLRKTTDDGQSWFSPMTTNFFQNSIAIQDIQVDQNDPNILIVGVDKGTMTNLIYRSNDGGATWSAWDQGITLTKIFSEFESVSRLYQDADNQTYYTWKNDKLYSRGINDASWTETTHPDPGKNYAHVAIHPTLANTIYATTSTGIIHKSTNKGQSWSSITSPTSISELIAVSESNTLVVLEKLWVGGMRTQKLFISYDDGANWSPLSFNGFGGTMKNMLFLNASKLLGTSNGQGANVLDIYENDSCPNTHRLTATTVDDNSATLTWDAIAGANQYLVQYKESTATLWLQQSVTNNSTNLSNLAACTEYDIQVFCQCAGGQSNAVSAHFSTTSLNDNLDYCTIESVSHNKNWLADISLNGTNYTSSWNSGYRDNTCTTTFSVEQNNSYSISLTPEFEGSPNDMYWHIWIDFNQDGDFDEADEFVLSTTVGNTGTINETLTIPNTPIAGLTRMRVICKRYTGTPPPCGYLGNGEIEDFALVVDRPCPTPTAIAAEVISGNVVRLSWDLMTDAERYKVRYRPVGGSWVEGLTANVETFKFLNGLTPNTTYQYQMKSLCVNENSIWSTTRTFTTLGDVCDIPASSSVSFNNPTEAVVSWSAWPNDTKYKFKYKPTTGGFPWTEITTSLNAWTVSNLLANTTYKYKLKTKCTAGWGNWSSNFNFTTGGNNCEMIQNGDFSQGSTNWEFKDSNGGGAVSSWSTANSEAYIDITNPGTSSWHIDLRYSGLLFEQGKTYNISYKAKAEANRNIVLFITQIGGSQFTNGYNSKAITTTMQTYTYQFSMTDPTDANARIAFGVGNNSANVTIDDVSIQEVGCTPFQTPINAKEIQNIKTPSFTLISNGSEQPSLVYTLQSDALVRIDLYSINGQKVGQLINQTQVIGTYQLPIVLDNFAQGMYFLRTTVRNEDSIFSDIQKVILSKK